MKGPQIRNVVRDVLRLPENFYTVGTKSVIELLNESGYADNYSEVGIEEIELALREQPFLTDQWIGYSEDKRTNKGWYISNLGSAGFKVGYFDTGKGHSKVQVIKDKIKACAVFIKNEIEDIRSMS